MEENIFTTLGCPDTPAAQVLNEICMQDHSFFRFVDRMFCKIKKGDSLKNQEMSEVWFKYCLQHVTAAQYPAEWKTYLTNVMHVLYKSRHERHHFRAQRKHMNKRAIEKTAKKASCSDILPIFLLIVGLVVVIVYKMI